MSDTFHQLLSAQQSGGADATLRALADALRAQRRHHELFDALLMCGRRKLGLPAVSAASIDELPEPLRSQVEGAYLEACREVGGQLLADGKLREAWMYLRPVGDKAPLAQALDATPADDEHADELIELGVHEGVSPRRGFEVILERHGVCNAITTYDGLMHGRPKADQQQVAALLVARLNRDLRESLNAEITRQEGRPLQEQTIGDLVADRDWLFLDNAYHIDTSHLQSVVRFARVLEEPSALELAVGLCEYGRRLSRQYQYQTEEPFADNYEAHRLFFLAQLGREVEPAVAYFRDKAQALKVDEHGSGPAEVYVALLARIGRPQAAMQAAAELIPADARTAGFAPSLLELARAGGGYDRLLQTCRERNDVLGFAAGLVEKG